MSIEFAMVDLESTYRFIKIDCGMVEDAHGRSAPLIVVLNTENFIIVYTPTYRREIIPVHRIVSIDVDTTYTYNAITKTFSRKGD